MLKGKHNCKIVFLCLIPYKRKYREKGNIYRKEMMDGRTGKGMKGS